MALNEHLSAGSDKVQKLSESRIRQLRKERMQKTREKFGLSKEVSDEQILNQESAIVHAETQAVEQTEQDFSQAEGNIAEELIRAAESGNDGDIQTALHQAQGYHQQSNTTAWKKLKAAKEKFVKALF